MLHTFQGKIKFPKTRKLLKQIGLAKELPLVSKRATRSCKDELSRSFITPVGSVAFTRLFKGTFKFGKIYISEETFIPV